MFLASSLYHALINHNYYRTNVYEGTTGQEMSMQKTEYFVTNNQYTGQFESSSIREENPDVVPAAENKIIKTVN